MVLCVVVGCSSKSGKHKGLGFFTNQGEEQEELTTKRRNVWISAVSRGNTINKIGADLHGTIFVACDKLTAGPRHDLRLSQRFKTCFKMLRHFF